MLALTFNTLMACTGGSRRWCIDERCLPCAGFLQRVPGKGNAT